MKRCGECKELDCPGFDEHPGAPACDDFTSEAIEEEPVEFEPTLEDCMALEASLHAANQRNEALLVRLTGYENAIADLVRWAQGDEAL